MSFCRGSVWIRRRVHLEKFPRMNFVLYVGHICRYIGHLFYVTIEFCTVIHPSFVSYTKQFSRNSDQIWNLKLLWKQCTMWLRTEILPITVILQQRMRQESNIHNSYNFCNLVKNLVTPWHPPSVLTLPIRRNMIIYVVVWGYVL